MCTSNLFSIIRGMSKNSGDPIKFVDNYDLFRRVLDDANKIVVLTGAGISAESCIPTLRWKNLWRKHEVRSLSTASAFKHFPVLVWQFHSYKREVAFKAEPNKAHWALAKYEEKCIKEKRKFSVITQTEDGLHIKAGSQKVVELHGALRKVQCTECKFIYVNEHVPICDALGGLGTSIDSEEPLPRLPTSALPKCVKCNSLLRPYVLWYLEQMDPVIMEEYRSLIEECHLCIMVGTSFKTHPLMEDTVKNKCVPVAEFNMDENPTSEAFKFYFSGPCCTSLPKALGVEL